MNHGCACAAWWAGQSALGPVGMVAALSRTGRRRVRRGDRVEEPRRRADRRIRLAESRRNSSMASSTGCSSTVERLMTFSTSAVAVCCCSDSRSSLSRRVFSMAMTAWLAKFLTSSISLLVNGRTSWR